MNAEQQQRLGKQMDDLHSRVNLLRQSAATFVEDLNKSNQSMADELALQLSYQRSHLAADTSAFINSVSSARQVMSVQKAQERGAHCAKLHKNVRDLRNNAANFLKATSTAHQSMATAQKSSMVKGRNRLMTDVTARREILQAEQSAVRTDHAEAAKVWANISQLKQKNRMKKGPDTSSRVAESAGMMASPITSDARGKDLLE